jgi:hypothetical protein
VRIADDEVCTGNFDIRENPDSTTDPALPALEVILTSWKPDQLSIRELVSGQYRVPMKRSGILAVERQLLTRAFCQLKIFNAENRVSRQRPAEFLRDAQVAGAQHSVIELIQQQQIGEPKDRVVVQNVDNTFESCPTFDVPLD